MIDVSGASIEKIIIHHIGSQSQEEGCDFSETEANPSEYLKQLLIEHYLLPLSEAKDPMVFYHESDITLNAMAQFSKAIFTNIEEFQENSEKIGKHLYSVSSHPNIVGGEFIVILFSGLRLDGQESMGLAVLKVESKDNYLDIRNENGTLELVEKEGIALSEIQKGALILSTNNHVLVIDIFKKRTKYWHDDFLKVSPKQTDEASLKVSRDILRGLSTRIENPVDHLEFNHSIETYLDESDDFRLGDLHSLSSQYLESGDIEQVFNAVQNRAGFEFDENFSVPTEYFRTQAKNVMRKTRIIKGVNLVVTDDNTYLNGIHLEEREGGIRAIIEFDLYNDSQDEND